MTPPQQTRHILVAVHGGDGPAFDAFARLLRASAVLPGLEVQPAAAILGVLARYPQHDVLVADARVTPPYAWDARLQRAAWHDPRIAAAVPLCGAAALFRLLDDSAHSDTDRAIALDRTVYCLGNRSYYEVPAVHGAFCYLRRDALAVLPAGLDLPGWLDALCRTWRDNGRTPVLLDYLHVDAPPGTHVTPVGAVEDAAYAQNHPLGGLRRAVSELARGELPPVSVPGLDIRPVYLHIMHFWGGGLDKWVRDIGEADPDAVHMILSSFRIGERGGQRLVLYSNHSASVPVRIWDIAQPIRSTQPASLEYGRILTQVIREFSVEAVVVSSLIGHSLEALQTQLPTIVVCHDYYPICQVINPYFGKTCERCTLDDLRRCARGNPLNSIFKDSSSESWHAMRTRFVELALAARVTIVVPSPSVRKTLLDLAPALGSLDIRLVPHGIDFAPPPVPWRAPAPDERLRLVVLGRQSLHKGMELLRIAAPVLDAVAEVFIVGGGKNGMSLADACGWQGIESYRLEELPALLGGIAPHAAILASVIPETFSYTLSELSALGIPVLATRLGSFVDRIEDGVDGFLFDPHPDALGSLVNTIAREPDRLAAAAANLRQRHVPRTSRDMAADYRNLLPSAARPPARFQVGIRQQTGLTEPYRQLSEAYASLTAAYQQTRDAYESQLAELERLREIDRAVRQWSADLDALNVRRRWWRARRMLEQAEALQAATRPREDGSRG